MLLADAITRVLGTAESLAIFAIVVDAKDDAAASFYERYQFRSFPTRPMRLFLTIASAAQAFQQSL